MRFDPWTVIDPDYWGATFQARAPREARKLIVALK